MSRLLIILTLSGILAACESTQTEIHSAQYGPPSIPSGFDTGGYSPAPFGTFTPTDNSSNNQPDLGKFHGVALPGDWKGFTGN